MEVLVLLLLVSTLAVSRATPATAGAGDVVSTNPNTNAFAAGVNECRRLPTPRPMNICSIDYEVPAGIAAIAEVIEYEINGNLMEIDGEEVCRPALLEALCAFRFPRCEGTNVIMRSVHDCSRKTAGCSRTGRQLIEVEGICSLNATVPLDSCESASSFLASAGFQHCSGVYDSSTKITGWMFEYMKLIDAELKAKLDPMGIISSLGSSPSCFQSISGYFCQFYGRCTNGHIELINSQTRCNDFLNCYPDTTADSLRTSVNCASWPLIVGGPGHSITTKKAAATTKSSSKPPHHWPTPYPIGNGCSLQCVTGSVLLTFTLFLNVVLL